MKTLFIILVLLKKVNANAQWYPQISGTTQNLRDVEFLNRTTGCIVGDDGVISKTTNGGNNWYRQNTGTNQAFWASIYCFNDSVVWG
jgi:photosystem II stability/assembly factor-like uncharacterized protein